MQSRGSGRVICGLWACAYGVVFALPYSQDAVFAHNQHTKFLAGLALAGYGDVAADWMACVADPFPSFSWLLKWQHRLLGVHLEAGSHPFVHLSLRADVLALRGHDADDVDQVHAARG